MQHRLKQLFLQMIIIILHQVEIFDNGSGARAITYSALDGEVENIAVASFTDSRNPAVTSTVNEIRSYGDLDATFEL